MDVCECCDLPLYSCGKQAEDKQRAAQRAEDARLIARGFIRAEYPGICARCPGVGGWYGPGTLIRHFPAEGWVAACCADGR